jgi:hypothetical protein
MFAPANPPVLFQSNVIPGSYVAAPTDTMHSLPDDKNMITLDGEESFWSTPSIGP